MKVAISVSIDQQWSSIAADLTCHLMLLLHLLGFWHRDAHLMSHLILGGHELRELVFQEHVIDWRQS